MCFNIRQASVLHNIVVPHGSKNKRKLWCNEKKVNVKQKNMANSLEVS